MRTVKILFLCHLAALIFGLGGLLIALPHPELWSSSPSAGEVFNFGIRYAGSLHILFGAATMLLFGVLFVGARKTLIFCAAATTISLSMELLGTSTGFPFGAYSYTSFLGFKVAGLVPYSIPLSWFYMGFTSYILASVIVASFGQRHRTAWSLVLGAYFLTVWDLVLDPAMASQQLPIHFWIWHQTGPYFGMPIRNLVGWSLTGLIYMGVSRLLWRTNLDPQRIAAWLPSGVYVANMAFAIALNLSAGLWLPVLIAAIFGLLPVALAVAGSGGGAPAYKGRFLGIRLESTPRRGGGGAHVGRGPLWPPAVLPPRASSYVASPKKPTRVMAPDSLPPFSPEEGVPKNLHLKSAGTRHSIAKRISLLSIHAASKAIIRRKVRLVVEGLEHVPGTGPVLIAARHFHHLYDGGVLLEAIPRKLHILVALDWVQKRWLRGLMEWACAMVDWPAMLRIERLDENADENAGRDFKAVRSVYSRGEFKRYLRRAAMDSVRLLRQGEALVVFPEAYPNIDPVFTPKNDGSAFLPFRPGFARLVEMAERDGHTRVAIVPAGLTYVQNGQWHVTLRFGPALSLRDHIDLEQLVKAVEEQVHALSGQAHILASSDTEEVIQL